MIKGIQYFVILAFVITLSTLIPAYAEVMSLSTDSKFYKGGSSITFSGTILSTDSPNVTIVIFDPNNKFVTLTSALADSDTHSFQTKFDTGTPSTQHLLTLKGVYNATAFIAKQENGKTISFVFSPDGSAVTPSPPTNLTATVPSSTEIDLNWLPPTNDNGFQISGYQIDRNDGNGFNPLTKVQTTTYRDIGLLPNSEHSYRVSAINAGGSSIPSNNVVKFTLAAPTTTATSPPTSSGAQSLDELLKQRMADAQRLQALLHGQNPAPQSSPSVTHTVTLSEKVGLNDVSGNNAAQKSESASQNFPSITFANFDIKNIIYPIITLVGVGIVIAVLYFKKKQKLFDTISTVKTSTLPSIEPSSRENDDDYAMTILKNRLAKGEITIDEYKTLKDELSEP
jgi:uncharacterized membrane protein